MASPAPPEGEGPRDYTLEIPAAVAFILLLGVTVILGGGELRWVRMVGAVVGVGSLPFVFLPMFTLRRHGGVSEGESYMATRRVVDQGLLGVVRHPQYLGYMMLAAAFSLLSQRWYAVVLGGTALVFFYLHACREEELLVARFGEPYSQYMNRVPRFNAPLGVVRLLVRRSSEMR